MNLESAIEHAANRGIADTDGEALNVLAREVDRLKSLVSDALDLLVPVHMKCGRTIYVDVRGDDLIRVLRGSESASVAR